MGDFHQYGQIATLHQFNQRPLAELEAELVNCNKSNPIALALPSLYSELETPALKHIVDQLRHVAYLDQIVIGLDKADQQQFQKALKFFKNLNQPAEILWHDGPRLKAIDQLLQAKNLAPTEQGKGRNVWYLFGYLLATDKAQTIALHDCDIKTYSSELLARLVYPIAQPQFSYQFCKGYYARVGNNMLNGRVCRLLVAPLLRAMRRVCQNADFIEYLESFRYALSGEISLTRSVIEDIRIRSDWGLEMGMLAEVHRDYPAHQICQVDLADSYDHKHKELSVNDRSHGLSAMSIDIIKSLLRQLATNGEVFSQEKIQTLKTAFSNISLDLIKSYQNDAIINGLDYDRSQEIQAVKVFTENISFAAETFLNPQQTNASPYMPSWKRVVAEVPDIYQQLKDAVRLDNAEFSKQTKS